SETEAKKYYDLFVERTGAETQIAKNRKDEAYLQQQIIENSGRTDSIINLAINTPYADYGAFVYDDTFYYTSAKDTGNFAIKRHTWTGNAFTSLYTADVESVLTDSKSTKIKGDVKTKLNEASAVITKDGQTMYFTRNNIVKGKRR